jgi:transcriptional regulator with XRE-family HTH domain
MAKQGPMLPITKDILKSLQEALKEAESQGISLAEIGSRAGLTPEFIGQVKRGERLRGLKLDSVLRITIGLKKSRINLDIIDDSENLALVNQLMGAGMDRKLADLLVFLLRNMDSIEPRQLGKLEMLLENIKEDHSPPAPPTASKE